MKERPFPVCGVRVDFIPVGIGFANTSIQGKDTVAGNIMIIHGFKLVEECNLTVRNQSVNRCWSPLAASHH